AVAIERAAGAEVAAGQRLVEAAHRAQAEQLLAGDHVERDLHAALGQPLGRRTGILALVVVDHRLSCGGDVDAVDAPAQPHALAEVQRGQYGAIAIRSLLAQAELELEVRRLERAASLGVASRPRRMLEIA